MKSATKALLVLLCLLPAEAGADLRASILRDQVIKHGLVPPANMVPDISAAKSAVGQKLFENEDLSLNSNMSCRTCHLDGFSSADGLANAIGVGGHGEGPARLGSGGAIVPRNTLPLWGRGAKGFDIFFWDGKVDNSSGTVVSQFGTAAPSDDPLVVTVHLPFVEIREMVLDDGDVIENYQHEDVSAAEAVYSILLERVRQDEPLATELSQAFGISTDALSFIHVAESIAHFIRDEFQVRETPLHRFAFGGETLSEREIAGGLIFYGKGRCVHCHNGPLFSDFKFHGVPFPQAGFGKNGFGVDYGRYNVTFDDQDRYLFRTPPLFNVAHTAPYSHSGAVNRLEDAVVYHFDPLRFFDGNDLVDRIELYKRLGAWAGSGVDVPILDDDEVDQVVAFLSTLSFD